MTVLESSQLSIAQLHKALALNPDLPGGYFHLGNLLLQSGRLEEAAEAFRNAVRQNIGDRDALIQLGGTLYSLERCPEALVALRTAVALDPKSLPARLTLGTALAATEDYEAAIKQLNAAIELDNRCIPAWLNIGHALLGLRQFEAAVGAFTHALDLDPSVDSARLNRALAWMAAGDFEKGLPNYESRVHLVEAGPELPGKQWQGEHLTDATLLIQSEQGLGDTLQFVRFVPIAKERAAQVVLQVQDALVSLLKPLETQWDITVVGASDSPPANCFCHLLSLPLLLGMSLAEPPNSTPYLKLPQHYREKWAGTVGQLGTRKIGLAWSGRIRPYENRAIPIAKLAPLLDLPNIEWVVLQKDFPSSDQEWLATNRPASTVHHFSHCIGDLADTAALMEQVDHVVSIDTAIAHLAGALGKPVSIVLPYAADWRWHADLDTSPWYPSARLFWQKRPGHWESAVEKLVHNLRGSCLSHSEARSITDLS